MAVPHELCKVFSASRIFIERGGLKRRDSAQLAEAMEGHAS